MRSPLRALHDYSRKRKLAAALYANLTRARPGGIDVTRQDSEGVAALMHLIQTRNDVKVVKNKHNLTLMFTADVERTFHSGVAAALDRSGTLALPNEDLMPKNEGE